MNVKLIPVDISGYGRGDLNSYYSGAYLIYEGKVRECIGYEDGMFHLYGNTQVSDPSQLFRFIPEVGFYSVDGRIIRYTYSVRKTYKKSLSVSHCLFFELDGSPVPHSRIRDGRTTLLDKMLADNRSAAGSSFVISRRLCVHNGKLITHYNYLTVGDYEEGVATTPIGAIRDRIGELTGGQIQCRRP